MSNQKSEASAFMGFVMSNVDCQQAMKMLEFCFNEDLCENVQSILQPVLIKDVAVIVFETFQMLKEHYPDIYKDYIIEFNENFKATCEMYRNAVHIPNREHHNRSYDYHSYELKLNQFINNNTNFLALAVIDVLENNKQSIIWSDLYYSHLCAYEKNPCNVNLQKDGNIIYCNLKAIINKNCSINKKFDISNGFKPSPKETYSLHAIKITKNTQDFFSGKKIKAENIYKLLICKIEISAVVTYIKSSNLIDLLRQSDWIYFFTKWIAIKYVEIFDCLQDIKRYDKVDWRFFANILSQDEFKSIYDKKLKSKAKKLRNTCHYKMYYEKIDRTAKANGDKLTYNFFDSIFIMCGISNGFTEAVDLFSSLHENLIKIDKFIDEVICTI